MAPRAHVSPIPQLGLVGNWRLDEAEGLIAADQSGHDLHGRLAGASWRTKEGRPAAYFPGTAASIDVPHVDVLVIEDDITIGAWIWKEGKNLEARWDAILSKSPGIWDYELLTSMARSDEPAFFSPRCTPDEVYGGQPVPPQRWVHVAVTRRGSQITFFLDGQVTAETVMEGAFTKSGGDLQIGHDGHEDNGGMHGWLADVVLYSRALDGGEILQLVG